MITNRRALDTRIAADYLDIAKEQSAEYAIMEMNKSIQVTGNLNPIREILNDYVANGNENTKLDYAKRIADYAANNDVFKMVYGNSHVEITNAERCTNIIRRAKELGKFNERFFDSCNKRIADLFAHAGLVDELKPSIYDNINALQSFCECGFVDEDDFNEIVSDLFYDAFTDYNGLKPDCIYDVDKDWIDSVTEGDEFFIDASGWEWHFNVYRDGEVYYMAADGSITTYWQDALPWCEDGFYICDKQVDSFGNIVLIIAMRPYLL